MKKNLLLFLLIFGQLSCKDDDCKVTRLPFFDIQSITLQNYRIVSNQGADYPVVEPLNTSMPVKSDSLLIRLESDLSFYAASRPAFEFSLLSPAYACSPTPAFGNQGTRERVDTLLITSLYPFDSGHPAGSSLNDLFTVGFHVQYLKQLPTMDIAAFLAQKDPEPPQHLDLRLKQKPDSRKQAFRIEYKFTNGESYTLHTGELLID